MNFLNNFVNEYKEILTMKKSHKDSNNKKSLIVQTISLTLIMAVIALFTALLFNTTKNLGYLFTMLNGIVLGSFIIYKTLQELRIRTKIKANYSIRTLLLFDSLELVILLLLSNLLIFTILMLSSISYILFIIYMNLLILFMVVQAMIETRFKNTNINITKLIDIVKGSIYIFALFYLLAVLIAPFDFFFGTVLIYLIVSLLYFYKVTTSDVLSYIYKRRVYWISGIFFIVVMGSAILNAELPQIYSPVGIEVTERISDEEYSGSNLVVTDDEIIVLLDNKIQFYNYDLVLTHTINDTQFTELYQWGDEIVVGYYEDTDMDMYYCKDATFYTIVNQQLIYRDQAKAFTDGEYYNYDGKYITSYSDDTGYIDENCYFKSIITTAQSSNNMIIDEKSNYVMLSIDGYSGTITNTDQTFHNNAPLGNKTMLYSNGHILLTIDQDGDETTEDDVYLGIIETKDILSPNTLSDRAIRIDIGEYDTIDYFVYTEDYVIITADGYGEYEYVSNTFILDYEVSYIKESFHPDGVGNHILVTNTEEGLKALILDDMNQVHYMKLSFEIQILATISFLVLLFTIMPLSPLKGGVIDD